MNSQLVPAADLAAKRHPLFPGESAAYAQARRSLLAEEIDLRRNIESVAEARRALPQGPVVAKNYRFLDERGVELGLVDLFGDKMTLVTYFWMYGPQRERPCPMCTNFLGPLNGNAADIMQKAALRVIGRSPVARQQAFARERGWGNLPFAQTVGDDYARDIGALTEAGDEYPALVVCSARRRRRQAVLGGRNERRNARPWPGPAWRSRHRAAVEHPRSYPRGMRSRLVSQARILSPTRSADLTGSK